LGPASGSAAILDEYGQVIGARTNCANMESWCLRRVCYTDGLYYEANEGIIPPGYPPIPVQIIDPPQY
jgi:hypothetical protein